MKLLKLKKAQSLIEYAVLSAVVISAFLLLQAIVKRGVSGGINEAAARMGEQYSVTNTVIQESRKMDGDQFINEETGTGTTGWDLYNILMAAKMNTGAVKGSINLGAHSLTQRLSQNFTSTTKSNTDAANWEKYKVGEADATVYPDFEFSK